MIEVVAELILNIVLELFVDLIGRITWFSRKNRNGKVKPPPPYVVMILYVVLGAGVACASLIWFPEHFLKSETQRIINLIVTPVIVGAFMHWRGQRLEKRGKVTIRLDSFFYGYLFALVFGLLRYTFAK